MPGDLGHLTLMLLSGVISGWIARTLDTQAERFRVIDTSHDVPQQGKFPSPIELWRSLRRMMIIGLIYSSGVTAVAATLWVQSI